MKRKEKIAILELIETYGEMHNELKRSIKGKNCASAQDILSVCQDAAVKIGTNIEKSEGEGTYAVKQLESYCESVYILFQKINEGQEINIDDETGKLQHFIDEADNFIRNSISIRSEVVFFPYKASMWDSLESIWKAALTTPGIETYVVPIPYFDRNPDGSIGKIHYEGDMFPEEVPVISYLDYDVRIRKPDAAFIHNPYDQFNLVTTVDPHYYSHELKKYVDKLIYVPYYATSGGMSENQASLSAYIHADYIVAQAPYFRRFFDSSVPDEKLLYMGSPKFDRVIRMCKDPGPLPEKWRKIAGDRKIYFYNTSLGGMLLDTEAFLRKMRYVFDVFKSHPEVCLLWRPHPLLESTFLSMRSGFYSEFEALRDSFISERIGIYDDTPDITETISHSYAYIGDGGTSVTSLFGIAGKPIFLLDNQISELPNDEYVSKSVVWYFNHRERDRYKYLITDGNKLFIDKEHTQEYRFLTDLSDFTMDGIYTYAVEIDGIIYCCGDGAQDILAVKDGKVVKKVELRDEVSRSTVFYAFYTYKKSIYLIPNDYPFLVKFDTVSGKVSYFDELRDVYSQWIYGQHLLGGTCIYKNYILMASPSGHDVAALDMDSDTFILLETDKDQLDDRSGEVIRGSNVLVSDEKDGSVWLLPYSGTEIRRWYPETGKLKKYDKFPRGFMCAELPNGNLTKMNPFSQGAVSDKYVVLSPFWGNKFIKINKKSGEISYWEPHVSFPVRPVNSYYSSSQGAMFLCPAKSDGARDSGSEWLLFSYLDRKMYIADIDKDKLTEISFGFDVDELKKHASGFGRYSKELRYCMAESIFNSLSDFLENKTLGGRFDREEQLKAYNEIAANSDGTCGEKVNQFIKMKLEEI